MKQIIFIAVFLFACTAIFGQGNPSNLPADQSSTAITVSPTATQNYVVTYAYRTAVTSHPTSPTTGQINPVIQYFDGLGRPVETVSVKGSQSGYDVIDHKGYDAYGNLVNEYLPYTKSANNGAFVTKTNFTSGQNTFLTGLYGSTDGSKGYTVTEYEKSPLNRVIKQGAPGNSWQLTKPVSTTYRTNTTADAVKTFNYTNDTPSAEYTFPAGKLYVTETTDEDGKTVREFKDMDGKVIQKDMNGAKTRYCYDQFGRLRSVMQPTATSPTGNYDAFQYFYDSEGRLIEKKLPRAVSVYYIYDSRDRLVLTQDGVQRTKSEWTYTIYDNFNRPVEQGTWATIATRASLTTSVNGSLTYMSGQASRIPLKYLYYDVYTGVPSANAFNTSDASVAIRSASDIGRQTGEKTKLPDSETGMTTWLFTAIYYDKFGRVIQTVSDNHLGGLNVVTNTYNFAGEITQTRNRHTADAVTTYTDTYFDLNHRGKLMKTRFKVNGAGEVLLSGNSYNEAGNLAIQYLHSESGSNFIQKNDYTYNIRGWMLQMNNPTTFTESDVFGMKLEYNLASTPLYNGNISKFTWGTTAYPTMMYAYTYDANNRLTTANFTKTGVNANGLDEGFAYDVNGNITKISRYDYNGVLTDSIKCTYSGNSIQSMYDKQGDVASVVDFPGSITPKSVNYDQNGNETSEPHRYIATTYNLLNLPKQIIWNGLNRKISYFYTFNGEKLRKTVEDNGTITKVDYCGPFVYETVSGTRSLKYILTPHGRAVKSGSSFEYEYNITDHLGNVRAVIKKYTGGLPMVVQARHYYSFGMEMSQLNNGTTINKYQYNGKEIQDDFGLYWYDYGARFYDPMVGRWHTIDPMAESYYSFSPFHFSGNNPMKFLDLNGMNYDWVEKAGGGELVWDDKVTSANDKDLQKGDKYLGKNVLVATHNRDEDLNEPINSAKFELYLEGNKEGPSATIMGNTVPADVSKYGTLAEGLYKAKSDHRSKYPDESALRILNLDGKDGLPTVNGNPNPESNGRTLTGVFFHSAGNKKESLFYTDKRGEQKPWTTGCQTSGSGPGRKDLHNVFMSKVGNFNGTYYLRRKK
ncbi:MAG: DUF6443 domain-containing protein [Draconibacterium sp.]